MWLTFYFLLCRSIAGYEDNMFDATSCNGKVMKIGFAYETLSNHNLNTCAQRCSRDNQCKSFDFNFQTCTLNNDKDPGDCSKMKIADVPSLHYDKHSKIKQCQNGGVLNSNVCVCPVGYAGELCQRLIRDCMEGYNTGVPNGVQFLQPLESPTSFQAFCRNGETVIMSRADPGISFFRDWNSYKNFFGTAAGDYWLGLDNMHYITTDAESTLILSWRLQNSTRYTQYYNNFTVYDGSWSYKMTYTGTYGGSSKVMGDSFSGSNGKMFSTLDKDNDENPDHCANVMSAGWWFGINCDDSCLTCALLQPANQLRVQSDEIVWHANMDSLVPKIIKMSLIR